MFPLNKFDFEKITHDFSHFDTYYKKIIGGILMRMKLLQTPSYHDIQEARKLLSEVSMKHWKHDDLWSPTWWFLLASTILPFIIWWRIVDKSRFFEIFSFGLLNACFAVTLDVIGVDFIRWGYPDKLFSMVPPLFPADLVAIPVSAMIIYQFFTHWKSFIFATMLWAAMFAYILEPIFMHFDMLALDNWKHTYSFFGFCAFGILNRGIMVLLLKGLNRS
jgi:hypothetical protein